MSAWRAQSFPVRHFQSCSQLFSEAPKSSSPHARDVSYSSLTVGVPREVFPNERRVSLTPQNAALLLKKGFASVLVERNAGLEAQFLDTQYTAAGAKVVSREEVFERSDIMLKVRPPLHGQEVGNVKEGSTIISFLYPAQNKVIVDSLASRRVTAFAVCALEHQQIRGVLTCLLLFRWI